MAQHISKMEDGHYLLESDEEYQKRTRPGCFSIIIGAIVVIVIIIAALTDDDKKDSSAEPVKTEQAAPTKPKNQESVKVASEPVQNVVEEEVIVQEIPAPTAETEPEEEQVQAEESSADEEPVLSKSEAKAKAKAEIKALEQKVTELFNQGKAYCKEQDYNSALSCLQEMMQIKMKLEKPNSKIDTKIGELQRMLQDRNK